VTLFSRTLTLGDAMVIGYHLFMIFAVFDVCACQSTNQCALVAELLHGKQLV